MALIKRYMFLVFFCATIMAEVTYAQSYTLNVSAGYGSYDHGSLKNFQEELILKSIPLNGIKALDMFPGWFNWYTQLDMKINPYHSLGGEVAYYYTGARNYLADYSGFYALDMMVNSYRFGVTYKNYMPDFLKGNPSLSAYLEFRAGYSHSNLTLEEQLNIRDIYNQFDNVKFQSQNYYFGLGPGVIYALTPRISLTIYTGYEHEFNASLKYAENKKVGLNNPSGNLVYSNWSGFRFRIGVTILLI